MILAAKWMSHKSTGLSEENPGTKTYIRSNSIYITFQRKQNYGTETRSVVARDQGKGRRLKSFKGSFRGEGNILYLG